MGHPVEKSLWDVEWGMPSAAFTRTTSQNIPITPQCASSAPWKTVPVDSFRLQQIHNGKQIVCDTQDG